MARQSKEIVIVLAGGVIQTITGIPKGTRVLVCDYDVDGTDLDELRLDREGRPYREFYWSEQGGASWHARRRTRLN